MPLEWVGAAPGATGWVAPDATGNGTADGAVSPAPEITGASRHADGGPPLVCLHLWPHRSLPKAGFAAFLGTTFALVLLPLLAVLGTPVMWGLMPFALGTVALVWGMLQKSYRDGEILEELRLWSDRAVLTRARRGRPPQIWEANPYWVSVHLHAKGGPVESYLTLKGGGREVELGAFLSRDEREGLHAALKDLWPRLLTAASARPGTGC